MAAVVLPGCGHRVDALVDLSSPLRLTADFPDRVERGGSSSFAGAVTVTNPGPPVEGVALEEAAVFVVQGGKVVCTPMPQDLIARPLVLPSGASQRFPARVSLSSCVDGELLGPGDYELYAVVVVHGGDVVAAGGPWPVSVTH